MDQLLERKNEARIDMDLSAITLELGIQLVALIPLDPQARRKESIEDKVNSLRYKIKQKTGFVVPTINIVDNTTISPMNHYRIKIGEVVVHESSVKVNKMLAIETPSVIENLQAEEAKHPIFDLDEKNYWINDTEQEQEEAKKAGYFLIDPLSLMMKDLELTILNHLHKIIRRKDVAKALDELKTEHGILLDEMKQKNISISLVHHVVKDLLREQVSIRNFPFIVEAILDATNYLSELDDITEYVRSQMATLICEKYKNSEGKLVGITVNESLELRWVVHRSMGQYLLYPPLKEEKAFISSLKEKIQIEKRNGNELILIVNQPSYRFAMSRLLERNHVQLPVLSFHEIINGVSEASVHSAQTMSIEDIVD